MTPHPIRRASRSLAAVCALLPASPLAAQAAHATRVIAFDTRGDLGGGSFDPSLALGAPRGAGAGLGSTHVHSLGIGGSLTLGFDVAITDGPGADFVVAENPFFGPGPDAWQTFAEVAFVEVSTDGVTFARIPNAYHGPQAEPGAFGTVRIGSYRGLAGATPCYPADAATDPRDLARVGGDAFDLAALATAPEVVAGLVDLTAIHEIRLVDVRSGLDLDSDGMPIRDAGLGSADIDAVTVLHPAPPAPPAPSAPTVALTIPSDGRFALEIHDPDGLDDLVTVSTSLLGLPQPASEIFGSLVPTVFDPTRVRLELPTPVPAGVWFQLGVFVVDRAGGASGARCARPDA